MEERPAPLVLTDGSVVLTWDHHAYVELLTGIVVRYAGRTEDDARALVTAHRAGAPPKGYDDACLMTHDTPYHWAMHIAHGARYWLRGVPADEPAGYDAWEEAFLSSHGLPFPYDFSDERDATAPDAQPAPGSPSST